MFDPDINHHRNIISMACALRIRFKCANIDCTLNGGYIFAHVLMNTTFFAISIYLYQTFEPKPLWGLRNSYPDIYVSLIPNIPIMKKQINQD